MQSGDSIGRHHVNVVRGERGLHLKDLDDGHWDHREKLYYCDQPSRNDLSVLDKANNIHKMSHPLIFTISRETAMRFTNTDPTQVLIDGFYKTEYEIRLSIDNFDLTWEFVIPESGTFDPTVGPGLQTDGVMIQQGGYDIRGNFRLLH